MTSKNTRCTTTTQLGRKCSRPCRANPDRVCWQHANKKNIIVPPVLRWSELKDVHKVQMGGNQHLGTSLGKLRGDIDVFIKELYRVDSLAEGKKFQREIRYTQQLSEAKIGPLFYGVVVTPNKTVATVTEYIPDAVSVKIGSNFENMDKKDLLVQYEKIRSILHEIGVKYDPQALVYIIDPGEFYTSKQQFRRVHGKETDMILVLQTTDASLDFHKMIIETPFQPLPHTEENGQPYEGF